ncbi:MAG TPA: hypothetical protein VN081_02235 [Dongiaceae bacterium]|nr:hypothetical protein [Dongiaceae bacterium]
MALPSFDGVQASGQDSFTGSTKGSDGLYGVYWVGQDGNVYAKGNNGQTVSTGNDPSAVNGLFRQIADPAAPTGNGSVISGGGSVGPSAAVTNGILAQIAGLDSGLTQAKNNNQTSFQSLLDNYNADATAQGQKKDSSLNSNDLSYLASQQQALVNSAKLRQSLLSTLIGMGALNGSGVGQANSTIGGALQTDLTGADNNYKTNANQVLSAWDTYQQQNEARKKAAEQTLHNANTAADNSYYSNKQDYLKTLAGLYPSGSSQGAEFLRQALALGPNIQATSNVPQYDFTPITNASYQAPELAQYLSGTKSLSVGAPNPNAGIGAFSTTSKKRTDLTAPLQLTPGS